MKSWSKRARGSSALGATTVASTGGAAGSNCLLTYSRTRARMAPLTLRRLTTPVAHPSSIMPLIIPEAAPMTASDTSKSSPSSLRR
uniref:ASK4 n=1 Tax=Arundo donax TaxID=35708 RepID=A0A0A8YPT9_ARUDO